MDLIFFSIQISTYNVWAKNRVKKTVAILWSNKLQITLTFFPLVYYKIEGILKIGGMNIIQMQHLHNI